MKNLTATICLAVALLFGSGGTTWGYTVKGIGADECVEILSDHDNGKKLHYFQRSSWTQGYITARNYASDSHKGKGVSPGLIYNLIITYCRENPLKDLDDASLHLYEHVLP